MVECVEDGGGAIEWVVVGGGGLWCDGGAVLLTVANERVGQGSGKRRE